MSISPLRSRIALAIFAATLALLGACSSLVSPPQAHASTPAAQRTIVRFTSNGLARAYILYVPSSVLATPGYAAPLLVMLHGKSQMASDAETYTGFDAIAESSKAIVVYGSGYGGTWNAGTCCGTASASNYDDVTYLDQVISQVEAANPINKTRVYMAGFSNGGMMAYRYACERAATVTAIAVGSATLTTSAGCRPTQPVSVAHMHGLQDATVPYNGTSYSTELATALRSVPSATAGFANQDTCAQTTADTQVNSMVTRLEYQSCPLGTYVRIYRSTTLTHTWTRDAATYGLDETTVAWNFLSPQHR